MANLPIQWWQSARKDEAEDPNGVEAARAVTQTAVARESAQTQRRWHNLIYWRHMWGREATDQFNYSMSKRPTSLFASYGSFDFQPPAYNIIGECADVYMNRLFRQRSWINVIPEAGNYEQTEQSKEQQRWIDGAQDELNYWGIRSKMGLDACENGTGFIKFDHSNDKIDITRPHSDCMLFGNPDADNQNEVIERQWCSRAELAELYKDDEAAVDAIKSANSAYQAFNWGGNLDCSDVIPLLDAWYISPFEDEPGRHVRVVGNYALIDEDIKLPSLPYESWDFHEMSSGPFGQGLCELILTMQDGIYSLMASFDENVKRMSWPKWLIEMNSGVNERALGDLSGANVKYQAPHKPEPILAQAISKDSFEYFSTLIKLAKNRVHISEQATTGTAPNGLQSAVALERWQQIDDINFVSMAQRLEDFDVRCARQLIRLGAITKPDFTLRGRRKQLIKWDTKWASEKRPMGLGIFGASRLPQTVAGRRQELESMRDRGDISLEDYMRYAQIEDIDGLLDMKNSAALAVDRMLDDLYRDPTDFVPPLPFLNLPYAKTRVEQRYLYESNQGTSQDILDALLQWREAVIELIKEEQTPAAPAANDNAVPPVGFDPASAGLAPPPGAPPAIPQIAPVPPAQGVTN